jgi:hypothetical protein
MKKYFFKNGGAIFLLLAIFLQGCKKFVEVPLPKNEVQAETVFNNEQTANAALAGLYSQLQSTTLSISNGGVTIYAGLAADEIYNTSPSTDLDPFYGNAIPPTNTTGLSTRLWNAGYKIVYHANSIIERLQASTLSSSFTAPMIAEAGLIRALMYDYLSSLFGDVPLVLSTDFRVNAIMPRTAKNAVLQQMTADLEEAYNILPAAYPTANRARPNKFTAAALLSRIYLYQGDWTRAQTMASAVIGSGTYSLVANLNNVFLLASNEIIWQLPKDAGNTTEGSNLIPSSATVKPVYALNSYLLSGFEAGDQRKINWLKTNTVSTVPYLYPNKYKSRVATPITEGYVVVRLAEIYLIRAEARLHLNDLTGAAADLNAIRNRAGLANTTATTVAALTLAIEQERKIELFAEWAHRWIDVNRTGRADAIFGAEKSGWQTTDGLFPIPQTEILKNPFLFQNPGY